MTVIPNECPIPVDLDALVAQVIQEIEFKLERSRKNVSIPFGYEYTRETIRAVHEKVYNHYEPKGILCRLDMSPIDVKLKARIRVTTQGGPQVRRRVRWIL